MKRILVKYYFVSLSVAFVINLVISGILCSTTQGIETSQGTALLLMAGLIIQTLISASVSLLVLFLPKAMLNKFWWRVSFYFSGSVTSLVIFILIAAKSTNEFDRSYLAFPFAVFLIVQVVYYFKMQKEGVFLNL